MDNMKQQIAIGNVVAALHAQDTLNMRLHKQWHLQGWPYYRAAWTEMTEAIGHLNWFWWKQGTFGKEPSSEQRAQLHMELVDVLHFGLSMDVIQARKHSTDDTGFEAFLHRKAAYAVQCFNVPSEPIPLVEGMETYICYTVRSKEFEVRQFADVCLSAGLTMPQLLVMYFAKQTLNKLRWNNGYDLTKNDPDAYVKMWPSTANRKLLAEDNVHLVEVLDSALALKFPEDTIMESIADGTLVNYLYGRLSERYNARHS